MISEYNRKLKETMEVKILKYGNLKNKGHKMYGSRKDKNKRS